MPRMKDPRTVAERVLAILGAFSKSESELSLSEIAQKADLTLSTAHRRAAELVDWGALEKGADGKYRIGIRLWELAALAPRGMPLRELALPYLRDLLAITGGNSQLAIRAGTDALFLERLRGRNTFLAVTSAANRLFLPVTAVGLVLLAHAPAHVQDDVLNGELMALTPYTTVDPQQLREILAEIRQRGYANSDQQLQVDTYSTAAPIFDSTGHVVAAIGLVLGSVKDRSRATGGVVASARSLSRMLGSDSPWNEIDSRIND